MKKIATEKLAKVTGGVAGKSKKDCRMIVGKTCSKCGQIYILTERDTRGLCDSCFDKEYPGK